MMRFGKRAINGFLVFPCLTVIGGAAAAGAQGLSPSDAASKGVTVAGIIECGSGYTSHELYDVKISLLEVVRGDKAWEHLKAASASNPAPGDGFEYLLARIRFEYFARGKPGDCTHELREKQFVALSASGVKYATPAVVLPEPALNGALQSGESLEGWVAFLVPQNDKRPLMTFNVDETGAVQHGGDMWFRLQ